MSRKFSILVTSTLIFSMSIAPGASASDQIPGEDPAGAVAIVGGTVHTPSGTPMQEGYVLFEDGIITSLSYGDSPPAGARVIDASGKHVYPGLFAANTSLGLTEIDAVRATLDFKETGTLNPNVRAEVAWNPDSELIPVARSNGILTALSAPQGGIISGHAAVMRLDGWTWEDMLIESGAALVINWPARRHGRPWWDSKGRADREETRAQQLDALTETIEGARAYWKAIGSEKGAEHHEVDRRFASLRGVIDKETPVLIRANDLPDIRDAVAWALELDLRIIIVGGAQADLAADILVEHEIPVIVTHTAVMGWGVPHPRHADYDAPFTLPKKLFDAGVTFAISRSRGGSTAHVRNLPHEAAMAAAFGLPEDEALRAITLYPAQILGVGDRLGSIEVGKAATLFIADGDILEITSNVETAFIDGREVDLSDRQKMLYAKYRTKYQRMGLIEK